MKQLAAALALLLTAVEPAFADEQAPSSPNVFTAAKLHEVCTHDAQATTPAEAEVMEQSCVAYFRGLTDAITIMQSLKRHYATACMPTGKRLDISDARAKFEAWIKDHPNSLSSSAGLIAAISVISAYRCNR